MAYAIKTVLTPDGYGSLLVREPDETPQREGDAALTSLLPVAFPAPAAGRQGKAVGPIG